MNTRIQMRNADFARRCIRLYEQYYKAGISLDFNEIIDRVLVQQPHSFYVEYSTASAKLHALEHGDPEKVVKEPLAREMWMEMLVQVLQHMARHPRKTFAQALTFVIAYGRPSRFFISRDTARRILAPYRFQSLRFVRC